MEDRIPRGLQHHYKTCCEKDGHRGRWACMVQRWHHCGDVVFRTGGLVYDIRIQRVALLCIYLKTLNRYDSEALL